MRGLIGYAVLVAAVACASAGAPPGGPPRATPPKLLAVTPDSGATNVRIGDVDFRFDEVINETPTAGSLDQTFLISPRDGAPRVSWHRTRVTIRPRHGFRPNTAYVVTMLPGVADLHGNVLKESKQIVFSTGAAIPTQGIIGRAYDWSAMSPALGAIVEAIRRPDSTVFITTTDSSGGFDLGPFGPGTYTLRGYVDQNKNFEVDRTEKWDSATVVVGNDIPVHDLLLILRDSTPPFLTNLMFDDSLTLLLTFDRPIKPGTPRGFGKFRVVRADSTPLTIDTVLTQEELALRKAAAAKRADSLRAAADTTHKPPAVAPPPAAPPPSAAAPAPKDTSKKARPVLKPSVPPPPTSLAIILSPKTPLERLKTYRVTADSVPGLMGTFGRGNRTLGIPKAPPKDTARAPGDSTRRPTAPAPVRRPQ